MHLWAHRVIQLGVVPVIVTIAMGVEGQLIQNPPGSPPAAAGTQAPPAHHKKHPSKPIRTNLPPSPYRTDNPGLQLTATRSPSSQPESNPAPPSHHRSPGGGSGGSSGGGGSVPQPVPDPAPVPAPRPDPAPTPTCIIKVLDIGVVCVKA